MVRFPLTALLPLVLAGAALAQNGDVAGEAQAAPPPHLEIPPAPTLPAEDALKTIQVAAGYHLEIAAADPLLGDPVAATFGPDGRLWVVEMRGFMPNPDGKGEDAKVGCVACLEDTDHDGRFDRRTVFLDGLVLPRALCLVGDGVLVAEPPHLWFCRDTDGDGKADEKTEVAADYGAKANPEHTANGLLRALDNWIYSANHNVRFRYLGGGRFAREATITRGQWGLSQDDQGRLFYDTNSDPLRYDAIPATYLARNPNLTDPAALNFQLVPANLRIWPLRVTPGVNRGYKSLDATGRITAMTAACAPFVYRENLAPDLRGSAFVCEPSGNLVKRIALAQGDDTITARNAYEGGEFIASTDERFRPVNLLSGPDGALYLVDMYRGIIQHRIYLTTYLRKQIESRGLAEGLGMGRIYRLVPDNPVPRRLPAFDLTKETTAELVEHLKSPDAWWRDTAQRLLVERRDAGSPALLQRLAADAGAPSLARVHALWCLEGMGALEPNFLLPLVRNAAAPVAATALRLSEPFLAAGDLRFIDQLPREVPMLPYPVVLQGSLSLGAGAGDRAWDRLLQLATAHGARPFVAEAIVSSLGGHETEFIAAAAQLADIGQAAPVLALAAACVWRSDDAARVTRLDQLLGGESAPVWAAACLVDSFDAVIPKGSDGSRLSAHLPAVPGALVRLAASSAPLSTRAQGLRDALRWPGNEDAVITATPLTPEQQRLFDKGREIFTTICAGCHQPNGQGLKGLAPSLVASKWVPGDERALARIVLQGKASEGLMMPPLGALDDESLAGALTFVRRSWGHGFGPVEPATIARTRREVAGRAEPWTDKDLANFVEENRIHEGSN